MQHREVVSVMPMLDFGLSMEMSVVRINWLLMQRPCLRPRSVAELRAIVLGRKTGCRNPRLQKAARGQTVVLGCGV